MKKVIATMVSSYCGECKNNYCTNFKYSGAYYPKLKIGPDMEISCLSFCKKTPGTVPKNMKG